MSEPTPESGPSADHDRISRIPRNPRSETDLTERPAPVPPPPPALGVEEGPPPPPPTPVPLRSDPLPPQVPYRDADRERAQLIAAAVAQAMAAGEERTPPLAAAPIPPAGGPLPTVSKEEAAVLRVMLDNHPVRVTAEGLAALLRPDEKSICGYLQSLQGRGLVTEPFGKTGRALTAAGLDLARSLPEGAGADLLCKKAPDR